MATLIVWLMLMFGVGAEDGPPPEYKVTAVDTCVIFNLTGYHKH